MKQKSHVDTNVINVKAHGGGNTVQPHNPPWNTTVEPGHSVPSGKMCSGTAPVVMSFLQPLKVRMKI